MNGDKQDASELPRKTSLRDILNHAQALRQNRQYEEAETIYSAILQQVPDEATTLRLLGTLRFEQGRLQEAVVCLRRSTELMPEDAGTWLDLANVHIEAGEFDLAMQLLRRSLATQPDNPIAYNSLGVACLRAGKLDASEAALLQGLELDPGRDDLLYNLGLLRDAQEQTDQAIELFQRAAELAPHLPDRWSRLADVLMKAGRDQHAVNAIRRLLSLGAASPDVYNQLGIAHQRCSALESSADAFDEGLKLDPDSLDLHHNLARTLFLAGRFKPSIEHCLRVLKVDPAVGPLRRMVSQAWLALGETDQAVANLQEWQAHDQADPEPEHMLAAIKGTGIPKRAPDHYVQRLFDDFADSFERNLQSLEYKAPLFVAAAMEKVVDQLPPTPDILDAGCGTGLCGTLLKAHGAHLVGVDLSPAMLDKARLKNVYDLLEQAELTAYLERSAQQFDAIVSADTLCYFGELEAVFAAAHAALRSHGVAIFSLEALPEGAVDYQLHVHGRYSHSERYVKKVLQTSGFEPSAFEPQILRREMNQDVNGWIVTARRIEGAGR